MKKTILTIALVIVLTACSTATDQNPDPGALNGNPNATPDPNSVVVSSGDDPAAAQPADYLPQSGDELLTRGNAPVDEILLRTLESYPVQVIAELKGNLPTACHALRVVVNKPDANKKINLDVYSLTDPKVVCAQSLQSFTQSIPLGSFESGHYTVWVNGKQLAEFDA